MPEDLDKRKASSGFAGLVGYRLTCWEENLAEGRLTLTDKYLNRQGCMHGGVLATLMDAIPGYCGIYTLHRKRDRRAMTLTLTTSCIGSGKIGEGVIVTAERSGGGQSVFLAKGEARDRSGRLLGTAEGAFKYRGDSGKSDRAWQTA